MPYNPSSATALSLQLKTYYAGLDSFSKLYVQDCLLEATGVKARRNVQTWLSSGSTSRNMLNKSISHDEYKLRETIIRAVLRLNNENVPLKTKVTSGDRKTVSRGFAKYIKDPYVGRFARSIIFDPFGLIITYDTYGTTDLVPDDINDEDLIEFEN